MNAAILWNLVKRGDIQGSFGGLRSEHAGPPRKRSF
ncbi:hypothetical protein ABIC09_007554 [Bradyrhizobium sp. S3.12.5]